MHGRVARPAPDWSLEAPHQYLCHARPHHPPPPHIDHTHTLQINGVLSEALGVDTNEWGQNEAIGGYPPIVWLSMLRDPKCAAEGGARGVRQQGGHACMGWAPSACVGGSGR